MRALALTAMIFALPLSALACKPKPVPDCADKDRVNFRAASFDALSSKVHGLQSSLDLALRNAPKGKTDCFNSHFSEFYLEQAKAFAAKHDHLVCAKHLDEISFSVSGLADPDSAEWKAVKAGPAKEKLEAEALVVKAALHDFMVVHAKP